MSEQIVEGMNLINGDWVAGEADQWQRVSPANESVVWSGQWASVTQGLSAVGAARQAFPNWAELALNDRIDICRHFANIVTQRKEELALLIAVETGKPLWEARTEVAAAIAKVDNSIDALMKRRWTTTQETDEFLAVTRYRPHGVMFVIGPFNFPAHIPGGQIIPALLAGNCVVFKPSEHAAAVGQWLCQAWLAAGIPSGVINLVHAGAEVSQAIVADDDVDGVLFTGSHRVGLSLHRALAGKPEKVLALEMGGNNALVVHDTNDIRSAAITTILSAYLTSGQRCTCARRLIVTGESAYQQLLQQLQEFIPQIRYGLPLDEEQPFMGPLVHPQAAEQILAAQAELKLAGGEVIVESRLDSRSPSLIGPSLVALGSEQQMADGEHFGPLLTIQQAESLDHAIALAGETKFGLAAGFIGNRVEDFHYFLHRVRAGVINWNRQTTGASGKLPFGGVGWSGNHHPCGYFAADLCSYPIASLESHDLNEATKAVPGLKFI
ncbi:MAG: succinylglutamate-semialdehyde dehydrogenase [Pirellulaceae bacterium]